MKHGLIFRLFHETTKIYDLRSVYADTVRSSRISSAHCSSEVVGCIVVVARVHVSSARIDDILDIGPSKWGSISKLAIKL